MAPLLLCVPLWLAAQEAAAPPGEVVGALLDETVAAARAGDPAEALSRAEAALRRALDVEHLAAESLGAAWGELADEERSLLGDSLVRWSAASYLSRFEGVERAAADESEVGPDRATVTAVLVRGGGETRLRHHLHREEGGPWLVREIAAGEDERVVGPEPMERALDRGGAERLARRLEERAALAALAPEEVVARLQAALVEAMRGGEELGHEGRRAELAPVVLETHDVQAIARLVLGGAWGDLDEDERERFTDAFREFTLASYAARFRRHRGERFEVRGTQAIGSGVLVKTVLVKADGGEVTLDHLMQERGGRWRVLNVVAEGVSDVALKRAEYEAILRDEGLGGLVSRLESQTRRLAAGEGD